MDSKCLRLHLFQEQTEKCSWAKKTLSKSRSWPGLITDVSIDASFTSGQMVLTSISLMSYNLIVAHNYEFHTWSRWRNDREFVDVAVLLTDKSEVEQLWIQIFFSAAIFSSCDLPYYAWWGKVLIMRRKNVQCPNYLAYSLVEEGVEGGGRGTEGRVRQSY